MQSLGRFLIKGRIGKSFKVFKFNKQGSFNKVRGIVRKFPQNKKKNKYSLQFVRNLRVFDRI